MAKKPSIVPVPLDAKAAGTSFDAVTSLCADFVARSLAQGWKGAARDKMALEYLVGATSLANVIKDETLFNMLGLLATLTSVRGFSVIEQRSKVKS